MTSILDMPLKKMKVGRHNTPYMTDEWKRAIRTKQKAFKLYRRNKNLENWESLRILRNNCIRLRRKAIREYWSNQSNSLKAIPRHFYKMFIPFLGSRKSKSNCFD